MSVIATLTPDHQKLAYKFSAEFEVWYNNSIAEIMYASIATLSKYDQTFVNTKNERKMKEEIERIKKMREDLPQNQKDALKLYFYMKCKPQGLFIGDIVSSLRLPCSTIAAIPKSNLEYRKTFGRETFDVLASMLSGVFVEKGIKIKGATIPQSIAKILGKLDMEVKSISRLQFPIFDVFREINLGGHFTDAVNLIKFFLILESIIKENNDVNDVIENWPFELPEDDTIYNDNGDSFDGDERRRAYVMPQTQKQQQYWGLYIAEVVTFTFMWKSLNKTGGFDQKLLEFEQLFEYISNLDDDKMLVTLQASFVPVIRFMAFDIEKDFIRNCCCFGAFTPRSCTTPPVQHADLMWLFKSAAATPRISIPAEFTEAFLSQDEETLFKKRFINFPSNGADDYKKIAEGYDNLLNIFAEFVNSSEFYDSDCKAVLNKVFNITISGPASIDPKQDMTKACRFANLQSNGETNENMNIWDPNAMYRMYRSGHNFVYNKLSEEEKNEN